MTQSPNNLLEEPTLVMMNNKQLLKLAKMYVDKNDADGFAKMFMPMTPQMFQMALHQQREEIIEKLEKKKVKIPDFNELYGDLAKQAKTATELMFYKDNYTLSIKQKIFFNESLDQAIQAIKEME